MRLFCLIDGIATTRLGVSGDSSEDGNGDPLQHSRARKSARIKGRKKAKLL